MVQALASTVLGAFSGQSRRERPERPQPQSALPAIAAAPNTRVANKLRKEAREERLFSLITQPEILGFAMALGGLAASNIIPFAEDEQKNALLQAVASTMTVGMGMGYAGVGDLTSLSIALAAGGASLLGGNLGLGAGVPGTDWNILDQFITGLNPLYPLMKLL